MADRMDAFVVGILVYAMSNGHDIYCEMPMSGKLKTLLEEEIISDLCDRNSRYYKSQVFADTINDGIRRKEADGTMPFPKADMIDSIPVSSNLDHFMQREFDSFSKYFKAIVSVALDKLFSVNFCLDKTKMILEACMEQGDFVVDDCELPR